MARQTHCGVVSSTFHGGVQLILSVVRLRSWVPHGRADTKQVAA